MLLLFGSSDRSDLLFSAISLEIRKEHRRFDTPKVFNGSCHKLFTASLQDWLYSRERHIPDREKMTMEGHTTSFALEVSKNQWSIRQDWHVDYVSSAHMPSAFLKAKPCFLDSHAWINQEGERHCFCYYRCLLWPWSNISPNHLPNLGYGDFFCKAVWTFWAFWSLSMQDHREAHTTMQNHKVVHLQIHLSWSKSFGKLTHLHWLWISGWWKVGHHLYVDLLCPPRQKNPLFINETSFNSSIWWTSI